MKKELEKREEFDRRGHYKRSHDFRERRPTTESPVAKVTTESEEEVAKTILRSIPADSQISTVRFEGPNIALYTKNAKFALTELTYYLSSLPKTLKKRFIIRTDPSVRLPEDQTRQAAVKLLQKDVLVSAVFCDDATGEGVLEVSKSVKIHVSTVYRLLNTLMKREFVDQNPETEKYRLGIRLFELGVVRLQQLDYRNIALPHLRALHEEFEETVFLGTLRGNEVLIIESFSQPRGIVFGSQIGAGEPLYCTGIGKALLANLAPEQRDAILKDLKLQRFTARTLTSRSALRKELDAIRQRGHSIDDEEIVMGVKCVAAPILGPDGYAVGAFSIAGPADRVGRRFDRIAARVGEVSRTISRELLPRGQEPDEPSRARRARVA